ncbi:hypothetical protein [Oceanospirillum beijerinckii]|uniref:hypothetical protein n=1 Tax=Oceanospirillum beijerinckii TaxID=64976 RepID=UPI000417BDE2|nr:hypothetical protein [Oceanospirillum beijerinckii]MAC48034.1 hypothetical protein [Oceanospirillum sp.]
MDIKLYTKTRFAADDHYQTVEKTMPGGEFSRLYSHSMADQQGRQHQANDQARSHKVSTERKPDQTAAMLALDFQKLTLEAAAQFHEARQANGIPHAPDKILFDQQGRVSFPDDYAFSKQLAAVIKQNPELEQLLSSMADKAVSLSQPAAIVGMAAPLNPPVSDSSAKAKFEQMVRLSAARGGTDNRS